MPIGIIGTGYYVPEKRVTNDDLAKMMDTSDEWIYRKVGVKERRVAAAHEVTSDLAVNAALKALEDANISVLDVDLIVLATSSPDMIQPPTASIVQGKLGAKNAAAFDVGAVCAGFPYALNAALSLQVMNQYKNVLVIGAEVYSRILDWHDRNTCVYFGDGAGAAVLSEVPEGYGFISHYLMTEGQGADVIRFLGGGTLHPTSPETLEGKMHRFEMQGKLVWDFAHRVFPQAVRKVLEKGALKVEDLDFIISHQANINIIRNCLELLGKDMRHTHTTIENFANTSGASIPITLADAAQKNKFQRGDLICLVGFGGGLSYGANLFRWY
jgi:3-oxoacyl-[acyl-carrier-protein] synthase-3